MFSGKKIFLTGASRGIGKSIKERFVIERAYVVSPTRAEMDLSNPKSIEKYLRTIDDLDFDVFVFCAGINPVSLIDVLDLNDIQETMQVNLYSSLEILKRFSNKLKERERGKIVFITSLYSMVSKEGRISYTASKHAICGVVKSLALELAPYNICVNAVAPGYVKTDLTDRNLSKDEQKKICDMIPMGRFQDASEISSAVVFLASDENKSITGQTVVVDGGFLCR